MNTSYFFLISKLLLSIYVRLFPLLSEARSLTLSHITCRIYLSITHARTQSLSLLHPPTLNLPNPPTSQLHTHGLCLTLKLDIIPHNFISLLFLSHLSTTISPCFITLSLTQTYSKNSLGIPTRCREALTPTPFTPENLKHSHSLSLIFAHPNTLTLPQPV